MNYFSLFRWSTELRRFRAAGFSLVTLVLLAASSQAQQPLVAPGLIATYTDGETTVVGEAATPEFRLKSHESIHPQIGRRFTAEWSGVLIIGRAGRYRLKGETDPNAQLEIQLNGKSTNELELLSTGEHALRIRYSRGDGEAQLNLTWESEYFREEPVPSEALGHVGLSPALSAQNAAQKAVEQGRYLFAELGCANCHSASNWNLQTRRGPDLSAAGERLDSDWMRRWLKSPRDYREGAVMPVCLEDAQDRADVTAFLVSLGSNSATNAKAALVHPDQLKLGKETFERVGCVKCHDKSHHLDSVGVKYQSAASLADYIADPHKTDPHGRMPQVFHPDERHLAVAVANYLFSEKRQAVQEADGRANQGANGKGDGKGDGKSNGKGNGKGDAQRGAQLFATHGCASCHSTSNPRWKPNDVLVGPAFGQPQGLPLLRFWDFDREESSELVERMTGTPEKVVGRTAFAEGRFGGAAFDFDGKSFIELQHFHRPGTMTITVWVKTTQGGSILTWGRPGGGQRGSRELRMNIGQDGKNSVCYGEYNSDGGWKPVVVRPTKVNLVDGQWHHLAVVRQGASIQHYIDGKPEGRPGNSQPDGGDYTDRLLIGALGLQANPANRYKGLMDGLSVWEMALSAEQIAELAAGASPLTMAVPKDLEIKPFDVTAGCLASQVKSPLPKYSLHGDERRALQKFLATVQPEQPSYQPAPLTQHELLIKQFRCTACHQWNDENIQAARKVTDDGEIVQVERPPVLTGVGEKLTASRLHDVLVGRQRNRPWLDLRMPHFGPSVHSLPELITASAGLSPNAVDPKPNKDLAKAGLELIGEQRGKASCITCHNYRGINRRKDGVVPAPDLAQAGSTVRRGWFERWMHDPQRLQPGTSMPQMFLDVSAEERQLRISQLWSAIVYQDQLPLPNGVLDRKTEGTRIVVTRQPVIFRMATVTPVGQIDRAINVGLPGGLNYTFDPVECQLKYAWKGPFLDAGPAWNGRGGNPVHSGNDAVVAIKSGHFVQIGSSSSERKFLGYRLEEKLPVFRYRIQDATVEHRVNISPAGVFQTITVSNASDDIVYQGSEDVPFTSKTGTREGDSVRFPKSDSVRFQIEMPLLTDK